MKRIIFSFFSLATLTIFLAFPHNIRASIRCESFSISPQSGDTSTLFVVTGVGCDPQTEYLLLVDDSGGQTIMNVTSKADTSGRVVFSVPGIPAGTFKISVGLGIDSYWDTTLTVTESQTPVTYNCGDIIPPSSHDLDTNVCPSNCPATESINTGGGQVSTWHCACGDLNQAPCPDGNSMGLNKGCREGQILNTSTMLCEIPNVSFGGLCNSSTEDMSKIGTGVQTAIGCVPFDQINTFSRFFITWGLGVGGGFSMLVFILAAFNFMTSSGDPAKLQTAKELTISAITGIIFLVFSVFLLKIIGVNILGLF